MQTGDVLDTYHSFVARLMRQPWWTSHVPDSIDARLFRLTELIGHYVGLFNFDGRLLQAQVFDVANDASCDQYNVCLNSTCRFPL